MSEFFYLSALPYALIAVDRALNVRFLNPAAEMLLGTSVQQAADGSLAELPGLDEELQGLCERVFTSGESISLFRHTLRLPMHFREVTMHVTPVVADAAAVFQVLITIETLDGLERVASHEMKQEAMRAAGVMAAMLAHEVKNPLAGIRGAAQLLEEVAPEHEALTELICKETDRIRDLLAQVEIFDDSVPHTPQPVNIHEMLQYVISIARSGFARHVTFKERYDPSLPLVTGHRDLLVQLLLNLVKNSAEALAEVEDATITLATGYRSGYRVAKGEARGEKKVALPVMVAVEDNGTGIPEHIRARLFEPFVSSKENGRGLGLAIVAKIASDLGAVVELDPEYEKGTRFMLWLPVNSGQ